MTLSLLNYVLLGFSLPVDGFYLHSFEIWLACTVVFPGAGNIGFTIMEYRLGQKNLVSRACGAGAARLTDGVRRWRRS